MRIHILESAVEDLYVGRLFYQRHGAEVGEHFFNSLFADIDSLAIYAGIHVKVFGYHRLLSKRFPYAIYYTVEKNTVVVRRVLDMRRDPAKIRRELS